LNLEEARLTEITYTVPDLSCSHCEAAVSSELERVAGVSKVDVDLETKRVFVRGENLDDASLKAAIAQAGYEAA
jgi:copper chaperone CopZ